MAPSPSADE